MQLVDLTKPESLAVLVYGKPGCGKTTFLGSACDDDRSYPVLHVDVSGNPETLSKRRNTAHTGKTIELGRIPSVIRLEKLSELNAIYDWFVKGQPDDHAMTRKGLQPGFKTLIFDGITAIQRKSFAVVLGQDLDAKPGELPIKPEWPTYAAVLRQMLNIAKSFLQDLRMVHVLISCLEHEDQRFRQEGVPATAYRYYEPGLQGQAVTELPGEALAVLRFAQKATVPPEIVKGLGDVRYTVAQLRENGKAYAKDQHHLGGTPIGDSLYLADPNVPAMLNAIGAK